MNNPTFHQGLAKDDALILVSHLLVCYQPLHQLLSCEGQGVGPQHDLVVPQELLGDEKPVVYLPPLLHHHNVGVIGNAGCQACVCV